jgi:hypothetical protein
MQAWMSASLTLSVAVTATPTAIAATAMTAVKMMSAHVILRQRGRNRLLGLAADGAKRRLRTCRVYASSEDQHY